MMAAQAQPAPQTYGVEDFNLLRLSSIHKKTATEVLHFVFKNGSSKRPQTTTLLEYYRNEGKNGFEKGLYAAQKEKLDKDPEGLTFDVTLLYRCLRKGSHGLSPDNDPKWNQKDESSIESLITIVKNKRNDLAHEQPKYSKEKLIKEAMKLKDQLTKIIELSGQLYKLQSTIVDDKIAEVESEISKFVYDDFEVKTFEEYKAQLFFDALSEYANDEGLKDVLEQYDKNLEDKISTSNHQVEISLPLDQVYTDMKLKKESTSSQDESISYNEVLLDEKQEKTKALIVINGQAGVGKTTFSKKILHDWRFKENKMLHLTSYDHLLKAECRNTAVKTFDDLLHHLMPRVSKNFKPGDLQKIILAQRVIIIMDGLDELNKSSANLFQEVLYLKKTFGVTVIVTTRPEKLNYIEQKLKVHHIEMKHIQLLGVPTERRDELVIKYHTEIAKIYPQIQDKTGLLDYLRKTELRLADLWRFPYNLTSITILWAYDYVNITNISTAPELYRAIFMLYITKLIERLQSNESTRHLDKTTLKKKTDFFVYSLARESIIGLKNDIINLSQEAYHRLEEVCRYISIPLEEMVSAFLKQIPSAGLTYSFPHKGLQDYFAAFYIWAEINDMNCNYIIEDILQSITVTLCQKNVPERKRIKILKLIKGELKTTTRYDYFPGIFKNTVGSLFPKLNTSTVVKKVFDEIHGASKYEVNKFQNMLVCLIGMFYLEDVEVKDEIKLEVLNFLLKTGIRDKEAWISILNSVKCDDTVAYFISKQPEVLNGKIKITDSSVSAYVSLLKALKPQKRSLKASIDVNIEETISGSSEIIQLIINHRLQLESILINDKNSLEYSVIFRDLIMNTDDTQDAAIDFITQKPLLDSKELLDQIRRHGFSIRTLKASDFEITSSNFLSYTQLFKSMPNFRKNAVHTTVDIVITEQPLGAEDLLTILADHQFKVRRFFVNEKNYKCYEGMLTALTQPMKDQSNIEMEMCIDEKFEDVLNFLMILRNKNVRVTKFQVKPMQLSDHNYISQIKALRSLPPKWLQGNKSELEISVQKELMDAEDLIELISNNNFNLKSLLITDHNQKQFVSLLRNLTPDMKSIQGVQVRIRTYESLQNIKELLHLINKRQFNIQEIDLGDHDIQINDTNVNDTNSVLKYFHKINHGAFRNKFTISIKHKTENVNLLFQEISKIQPPAVKIDLQYDFCHPRSPTAVTESVLNKVFRRCRVDHPYKGPMVSEISNWSGTCLSVSIPDTSDFIKLRDMIENKNLKLISLDISVALTMDLSVLCPLPDMDNLRNPPNLFIPDIKNEEDITKACEIATRLQPSVRELFSNIYFPRCKLKQEGIKTLLFKMDVAGIKLSGYITMPLSCRPQMIIAEEELQEFYTVVWGRQSSELGGTVYDVHSWNINRDHTESGPAATKLQVAAKLPVKIKKGPAARK